MCAAYDEELCPSILVVYNSDNDSPDKFFPADPHVIKAHRDSLNEPRRPPSALGSLASGITAPFQTKPENWEANRSMTTYLTKESSMRDASVNAEKKNGKVGPANALLKSAIVVSNRDVTKSRKAVTFSKVLEFVEYRRIFDEDELNKRRNKQKFNTFQCNKLCVNEKKRKQCSWTTNNESTNIFKKVARIFGIFSRFNRTSRISTILGRFRTVTPRFAS